MDALRERLLAVAGRMNRAVVGKQKREEWAKEKEAREAKGPRRGRRRRRRRGGGWRGVVVERGRGGRGSGGGRGREDDTDVESEDEDDADEEGYASLSEETLAELRAAREGRKQRAKKKGKKSSSGGGGGEDAEDLDLGPKKKKVKKRMGQRKRRQIAEAKFGANARTWSPSASGFVKSDKQREEERNMHPSWQANAKQAPLIIHGAKGKKVKFGEAVGGGSTALSRRRESNTSPRRRLPRCHFIPRGKRSSRLTRKRGAAVARNRRARRLCSISPSVITNLLLLFYSVTSPHVVDAFKCLNNAFLLLNFSQHVLHVKRSGLLRLNSTCAFS